MWSGRRRRVSVAGPRNHDGNAMRSAIKRRASRIASSALSRVHFLASVAGKPRPTWFDRSGVATLWFAAGGCRKSGVHSHGPTGAASCPISWNREKRKRTLVEIAIRGPAMRHLDDRSAIGAADDGELRHRALKPGDHRRQEGLIQFQTKSQSIPSSGQVAKLARDSLGESWPSRQQLFKPRAEIELNKALTGRKPLVHRLLCDVVRNIYC